MVTNSEEVPTRHCDDAVYAVSMAESSRGQPASLLQQRKEGDKVTVVNSVGRSCVAGME